MKSIFFILLYVFLFSHAASSQMMRPGQAVKSGASNPSLSIISYEGSSDCYKSLRSMLEACDWFNLSRNTDSNASIQIRANSEKKAGRYYLSGQALLPAKGKFVKLSGEGATPAETAAAFVDMLLRSLYNIPALCTRKIVFTLTGQKHMKELFCCNLDGSELTRLTNNNAISTEASWGHAGAFVYTLNKNNSLGIVLYDWRNRKQRTISSARSLNATPALSRSGRYVAMAMSIHNKVDMYVIDLKTSQHIQITNDRDVEASPAFSPDGQTLCYVSDKSGNPQIYMSRLDGSIRPVRLTTGRENVSPEWSPVSNMLCFSSRLPNGQYVISVMDMKDAANGGGKAQIITNGPGDWEAPSWAPDGRHIICTCKKDGIQRLYIVDSWLCTANRIAAINTSISLPSWQPGK